MTASGGSSAVELAIAMGRLLDDIGVAYAIGGSVAAAVFGEARATVDIDVAVRMDLDALERLLTVWGRSSTSPPSRRSRPSLLPSRST